MLTVRVCLFGNGARMRVEVWDQAGGIPVLKEADGLAESGRGLALVDALTGGRWGWHPAPGQAGKCAWAEFSRDLGWKAGEDCHDER